MDWGPVKPALVKKLISLLDISGAEVDKTKGRIGGASPAYKAETACLAAYLRPYLR